MSADCRMLLFRLRVLRKLLSSCSRKLPVLLSMPAEPCALLLASHAGLEGKRPDIKSIWSWPSKGMSAWPRLC